MPSRTKAHNSGIVDFMAQSLYIALMRPDRNSMTPLKSILSQLFRDGHLPFNPDDARIWEVWEEVVGPTIANQARPSWIKDGRLRVKVSDPIWLQELKFVEGEIRGKLNKELGRNAVERIEFRVGPRE